MAANDVATWDTGASAWTALGSGISNGYFSGEVDALALNGTSLIAGGDFTQAGSASVNSLAVWSGSAWSAIDGTGSGVKESGSEGTVDALFVKKGTLYVGGAFDHLQPGNAATQGGLASFNLASPGWRVLPIAQLPATVDAFADDGTPGVVVGGSFDTGGPLATGLFLDDIGVLKVTKKGPSWSALGQGATYGENGAGIGYVLGHGSGGEYLGGWFDQAGSALSNGLARWDGDAWHAVGGSGIAGGVSSTGPTVQSIAVKGKQVWIGGDFSSVGGVAANDIAVFDGTAWHAVGGGTNGVVDALAFSGNYVYAGGSFTTAGGQNVGVPAARWDPSKSFTDPTGWSALGPVFGAGSVTSFAFDKSWVILGGDIADCEPNTPCAGGCSTPTYPCHTASGWDLNGLIMWNTTTPGSWYYPFGCGVTVGSGATANPGAVTSLLLVGTTL